MAKDFGKLAALFVDRSQSMAERYQTAIYGFIILGMVGWLVTAPGSSTLSLFGSVEDRLRASPMISQAMEDLGMSSVDGERRALTELDFALSLLADWRIAALAAVLPVVIPVLWRGRIFFAPSMLFPIAGLFLMFWRWGSVCRAVDMGDISNSEFGVAILFLTFPLPAGFVCERELRKWQTKRGASGETKQSEEMA